MKSEQDALDLQQRLADKAGTAGESSTDTPVEPTGDGAGEAGESPAVTAAVPTPAPVAPVVNSIFAALPGADDTLTVKVFASKADAAAKMDLAAFKAAGGRFFTAKEIVPKVRITL